MAPSITVQTIGQFAEAGKAVFEKRCAKCHGEKGQGGKGQRSVALPLIGSGADIEAFVNAKFLFDYISTIMPQDAPGSLSKQDYLDVLSFLLVENSIVPPGRVMTPNQIENFPLQK